MVQLSAEPEVPVSKALAEAIRLRFADVQDVKFASTRRGASLTSLAHEPDIAVETWMNSRLYVYLCGSAPKSRTIKAILKQNTSASIGSLFLLDLALLPDDGYCGKLPLWQDDLRALNLGAIQAYEWRDGELRLIQVSLDETPQRNIFTVWHTRDFPLDALAVRRRDYQTNIRGSWAVGDITSPQFKRQVSAERARQRFHYRTRGTKALEAPPAEQISAAYLALQIEVGAGQDAVKEAFRKLARQYHPDVSQHETGEAERRFKEVKSAYDQIKSHRRWS